MQLGAVQHGDRVFHAVDQAGGQGRIDLAQRHRGRGGAHRFDGLDLHHVVRDADLHSLEVGRGVDRLLGEDVAHAVQVVGHDDVHALLAQRLVLLLEPVALIDLEELLGVVGQIRAEQNAQIRIVILQEADVGQGDDVHAHHRLFHHVLLRAQLGAGEQLQGDFALALFLEKVGPVMHHPVERLARIVLIGDHDLGLRHGTGRGTDGQHARGKGRCQKALHYFLRSGMPESPSSRMEP